MFSLFILSQISIIKGITSPQITDDPMNDFKPTLRYYFMKYDIDTLKFTNMNKSKAETWYNDDNLNYEKNVKELKEENNDIMNDDDTSYYLNRLPSILSALKDLKEKNGLTTLTNTFKYNQTVLSNALEHIYGEGLDSVYHKLKDERKMASTKCR